MNMEAITLTVHGMSCMGCVNSVKRLLSELPGVQGVEVDLASGQVQVRCTPGAVEPAILRRVIEDGGYQVIS